MSKDNSHDHVPRERLVRRYKGHVSMAGFLAAFLFIVAVVFSTFKPFVPSATTSAAPRLPCVQLSTLYGIAMREQRTADAQRLRESWLRECSPK